jgi:hypothetical protein
MEPNDEPVNVDEGDDDALIQVILEGDLAAGDDDGVSDYEGA